MVFYEMTLYRAPKWLSMTLETPSLYDVLMLSAVDRYLLSMFFFFFSSRRRHTRLVSDWSSDVCSSDLPPRCVRTGLPAEGLLLAGIHCDGKNPEVAIRRIEERPLRKARDDPSPRLHRGGRQDTGLDQRENQLQEHQPVHGLWSRDCLRAR